MTRDAPRNKSTEGVPARRYGTAVGEPPLWADPRRWGSLLGLAGGLLFIGSYSAAFGHVVRVAGWTVGVALAAAALTAQYLRPVSLGPLTRPTPAALAIYGGCVVGELAAINLGSRVLIAGGHDELRPALIAAVVGLHFIPFAWAFERMFYWLGGLVAILGTLGLVVGLMRTPHAAEAAAVAAGLVMLIVINLYARGRFAPRPAGHTTT